MKRIPIILVILYTSLCNCSEDEGICTQDLTSRVKAGFYVRDMVSERDTILDYLTFYATERPDSIIYNASPGIQKIEFPLSQSSDGITSFVFRVDTLVDTIHIYHQSIQIMVSFECGFTTEHDIYWISYQNNAIDTIAVPDPIVKLTDEENLKIYVWPAVADTAL